MSFFVINEQQCVSNPDAGADFVFLQVKPTHVQYNQALCAKHTVVPGMCTAVLLPAALCIMHRVISCHLT